MTQKGLIQTLILVVVLITVVLTVYFLRSLYRRNNADFGTWTDFETTICDNEAQGCTVEGTATRYRICTPNVRTGFGCIDSTGKHTYRDERIPVTCKPACYSAVWSEQDTAGCQVYDDQAHTTLSANQSCKEPPQFTFERKFKTCVAFDATGPVACVRSNGNLASIGDTEDSYSNCDSVPDCYTGTWAPCPGLVSTLSEYCGGTVAECGAVIPTTSAGVCLINDVPVASSNCYPPDDPGPCPRSCFNYPCDGPTWPAGFSNVNAQLGKFVELFLGGDALVPNWQNVLIACDPNPIATNSGSPNIVITTPAPHGLPVGEFVTLSGVIANVNGIPPVDVNGLRQIIAATAATITLVADSNATSTGSSGGSSVQVEQDPLGAAILQQDVYNSFGPQVLTFAPSVPGERIRFRIIPSQAEAPSGAFYMVGHLPYNGQPGIMSWNGSALVLNALPVLNMGETFDDVLPRPHMFTFSEPSEPQRLNLYTLPGPVLTDLFCVGPGGCLTFSTCDYVLYDPLETCV